MTYRLKGSYQNISQVILNDGNYLRKDPTIKTMNYGTPDEFHFFTYSYLDTVKQPNGFKARNFLETTTVDTDDFMYGVSLIFPASWDTTKFKFSFLLSLLPYVRYTDLSTFTDKTNLSEVTTHHHEYKEITLSRDGGSWTIIDHDKNIHDVSNLVGNLTLKQPHVGTITNPDDRYVSGPYYRLDIVLEVIKNEFTLYINSKIIKKVVGVENIHEPYRNVGFEVTPDGDDSLTGVTFNKNFGFCQSYVKACELLPKLYLYDTFKAPPNTALSEHIGEVGADWGNSEHNKGMLTGDGLVCFGLDTSSPYMELYSSKEITSSSCFFEVEYNFSNSIYPSMEFGFVAGRNYEPIFIIYNDINKYTNEVYLFISIQNSGTLSPVDLNAYWYSGDSKYTDSYTFGNKYLFNTIPVINRLGKTGTIRVEITNRYISLTFGDALFKVPFGSTVYGKVLYLQDFGPRLRSFGDNVQAFEEYKSSTKINSIKIGYLPNNHVNKIDRVYWIYDYAVKYRANTFYNKKYNERIMSDEAIIEMRLKFDHIRVMYARSISLLSFIVGTDTSNSLSIKWMTAYGDSFMEITFNDDIDNKITITDNDNTTPLHRLGRSTMVRFEVSKNAVKIVIDDILLGVYTTNNNISLLGNSLDINTDISEYVLPIKAGKAFMLSVAVSPLTPIPNNRDPNEYWVYDTFTGPANTPINEHVGEIGAAWGSHSDNNGGAGKLSGTGELVTSDWGVSEITIPTIMRSSSFYVELELKFSNNKSSFYLLFEDFEFFYRIGEGGDKKIYLYFGGWVTDPVESENYPGQSEITIPDLRNSTTLFRFEITEISFRLLLNNEVLFKYDCGFDAYKDEMILGLGKGDPAWPDTYYEQPALCTLKVGPLP